MYVRFATLAGTSPPRLAFCFPTPSGVLVLAGRGFLRPVFHTGWPIGTCHSEPPILLRAHPIRLYCDKLVIPRGLYAGKAEGFHLLKPSAQVGGTCQTAVVT